MLMEALFASYTAASKKLGLAFEEGRIHGAVDGVAVQMWFGAHQVHVAALLAKPAQIELGVATKTLIGKLGDLFGGHTDGIGDPLFDEAFSVKSPNLGEVAALLNADARRALLEAADQGMHPALDAHSIHLRRFSASAVSDSAEKVEQDFRATVGLARVVSESFAARAR